MAQTRAQGRDKRRSQGSVKSKEPAKASEEATKPQATDKKRTPAPDSRKRKPEGPPGASSAAPPSPKKSKPVQGSASDVSEPGPAYTLTPELEKLITEYGSSPVDGLSLASVRSPEPSTLLAHLLHALLTSARISHNIAIRTLHCCIEASYHDLPTLEKSTWEERCKVLTDGGYTRYREKTSTQLGELVGLLRGRYDGDLNRLRDRAGSDPKKIREAIKEVKGIGDVGVNIFFDTAQGLWPCLAPFVDPRSLDTAGKVGVGKSAEELWEGVGRDPGRMARVCAGLTRVRLEGKIADFRS
ncbi:MAG: hypothetical protein LQ340_005203 [Diploschistes diacapsis]|nr:MAG: hypothetical protein LQ340_005203 [Diploschistes diacapsis]